MALFDGCWQRIERAQAHRQAFAKIWNEFSDGHVYDIVVDVENEGTGGIWIKPLKPIPSVLSLELGELLYQLRAALDGCVHEAAILDSGQDPPPNENHLYFPIVDSAAEFNKRSRDIGPLAQKRRDIIAEVQPYNGGVVPPHLMVRNFSRSFAILNDWARKDRHRRIHVTGSWVSSVSPQLRVPPGCSIDYLTTSGTGFLEHNDQIARFKLTGYVPGMIVQANPYLALDIGVDEGPPPCADNDTLGNRIETMIFATYAVVGSFRNSF